MNLNRPKDQMMAPLAFQRRLVGFFFFALVIDYVFTFMANNIRSQKVFFLLLPAVEK